MKIKIVFPNFKTDIKNLKDFEYSLGYVEIINGKSKFSFFQKSLCMVFLTLQDLIGIINKLKLKENDSLKWIGVDNGFAFNIHLKNEDILFKGNDFVLNLNYLDFNNALKKSFYDLLKKITKYNPEILNQDYIISFKTLIE
jgi:hypothetical protein